MNVKANSFGVSLGLLASIACCCIVQDEIKLARPDSAALEAATKLIQTVYKEHFDRARNFDDKRALAELLLRTAMETKDDPAGRFALCQASRDLAIEARDVRTSFASVRLVADTYDIDRLDAQLDVLKKLFAKRIPESSRRETFSATETTVDEAVRADRYEVASQAVVLAIEIARGNRTLVGRAMELVKDVRETEAAHKEAAKAEAILKEMPVDPAANLTAGRFLCLFKRDWARGLPHLAFCEDPALRSLAEIEIAGPGTSHAKMALGDGWWEQGESASGVARESIRIHAFEWYSEALPELTGLARAKTEKRVQEIQQTGIAIAGAATAIEGTPQIISATTAVRADRNIRRNDGYWGQMTIGFNWAEWDIEIDLAGNWYVFVLMASAEPRPGTFIINGEPQPGEVLGDVTGGYHRRNAKWIKCGPYILKHGKNVLRFQLPPRVHAPHIKGFYVTQSDSSDLSGVSFDP